MSLDILLSCGTGHGGNVQGAVACTYFSSYAAADINACTDAGRDTATDACTGASADTVTYTDTDADADAGAH